MVPQSYWPAGPEENTPAIDAVLNHRLREDTSQLHDKVLLQSGTNLCLGKEITDPGRDDFEYYVSSTIPDRLALSSTLNLTFQRLNGRAKLTTIPPGRPMPLWRHVPAYDDLRTTSVKWSRKTFIWGMRQMFPSKSKKSGT